MRFHGYTDILICVQNTRLSSADSLVEIPFDGPPFQSLLFEFQPRLGTGTTNSSGRGPNLRRGVEMSHKNSDIESNSMA